MKVDYHVHLEEGPYSLRWWKRTAEAFIRMNLTPGSRHSISWMEALSDKMASRVAQGAYHSMWLDLYRQKAKELGLKQVGIVDHLYRFRECKTYFETYMHLADDELGRLQRTWLDQVCTTSMDEFARFLSDQKQVWAEDGIELKLGVEADFFPGGERELAALVEGYEWDYVIGSIHCLDGWGFDNPDTAERFEQFDLNRLYDRFFEVVESAVTSKLFDIIAHLDNLKVFGHRPDEQQLVPCYQRIAALLAKHDVATEINTGLYYRYPVREMCPSPAYLQALYERGVVLTTSSDSHFPDDVGAYLSEARERLREVGYAQIATFTKRQRKMVPLEQEQDESNRVRVSSGE